MHQCRPPCLWLHRMDQSGNRNWLHISPGVYVYETSFQCAQVSTGSICVTCRLEVPGPVDLCDPKLCWCSDITDKEKLMDCGRENYVGNRFNSFVPLSIHPATGCSTSD